MRIHSLILAILLLASASAQAINGPGGQNTYCVWRSSAPNESPASSVPVQSTMDEWGYVLHDYSETGYGDYGFNGSIFYPIPPVVCQLPIFVQQLQSNHSLVFIASHADTSSLVVEVYHQEFGAQVAKAYYETIGGYTGLGVKGLPQGWGLVVDEDFFDIIDSFDAKIILDVGCENSARKSMWDDANHVVGYEGSLGPLDLWDPLWDFFRMLHFSFDPATEYDSFPTNYQHSFTEAASKNSTLKLWKGGEVALGPTFVPFLHKHYERNGPGALNIYFDLNMPCSGLFTVSSFDSEVAHVTGTGFVGGEGNMFVTIHVTGAGNSLLQCTWQNITSPNTPGIPFNGGNGFSVQFAADTTPNANIEHFSVVNETALIRIAGKHNTKMLLIEGSNQEAGPYEEITNILDEEIFLGLTSIHQLPVFEFYRLRELEDSGNIIIHSITRKVSEEVSQTTKKVSRAKVEQALAQMMQRPAASTSPNKLAIMTPNMLANPMYYYQSFWLWQGVQTDIFVIDELWDETSNPEIFRANHKNLMNSLIAQGYNAFLLVGDASDNYEIQTPWPVEHGWEQKRQEMLNGDYTPQPNKNILPSPVVWYDPVLSQESGTNLPYFFNDWLLLDADDDRWPDEGLVIGRLPFSEEWQLWNYLSKLIEYADYGLQDTPINTLMLLGDVNHFGEFDGDHAVSVMQDHEQRVTWPKFYLSQSDFSSEYSRAIALRDAWGDDDQRWNFVISVASYSTRYKLGNFINLAFDLNTVLPSMTHYPFMYLNSCTTGNYWWTENGGVQPRMEYLLEHTQGAIGLLAHSDGSWQEQNREKGIQFTNILAEQTHLSWGTIAAMSIQALKNSEYRAKINALRTVFLGDPLITPRAHNPYLVPTSAPQTALETGLRGNHPNPFNPQTKISYDLAQDSQVELSIYDVRGRQVARLVKGKMQAGRHHVIWKGTDEQGRNLSSGLYFCRLTNDQQTSTVKMTLVK